MDEQEKEWVLTVRLTEFADGEITIKSKYEPNFLQVEEYVRRNFDKIQFDDADQAHWRVSHINGVKTMKGDLNTYPEEE